MTAFDTAWDLMKADGWRPHINEPMIEFGGNNLCPKCGSKMVQIEGQIDYDRPIVFGWRCLKCKTWTPHDVAQAHDLELDHLCQKCYGTGEQDEINRKYDEPICDECDGKGWV